MPLPFATSLRMTQIFHQFSPTQRGIITSFCQIEGLYVQKGRKKLLFLAKQDAMSRLLTTFPFNISIFIIFLYRFFFPFFFRLCSFNPSTQNEVNYSHRVFLLWNWKTYKKWEKIYNVSRNIHSQTIHQILIE